MHPVVFYKANHNVMQAKDVKMIKKNDCLNLNERI
jgi:hypothetical protein